jgi:hypothetical protein
MQVLCFVPSEQTNQSSVSLRAKSGKEARCSECSNRRKEAQQEETKAERARENRWSREATGGAARTVPDLQVEGKKKTWLATSTSNENTDL